jgi:hypothetical protein
MAARLERETTHQIQSKTGRLIDALQALAILDACDIASELAKDVILFRTSEMRFMLSEVSDLLRSEAVFRNCARLSYLLLDLEQRLSAMPLMPVEFCALQRIQCETPFISI